MKKAFTISWALLFALLLCGWLFEAQAGGLGANPGCGGPACGAQPGCCEHTPSCCDNVWDGYCQERARSCGLMSLVARCSGPACGPPAGTRWRPRTSGAMLQRFQRSSSCDSCGECGAHHGPQSHSGTPSQQPHDAPLPAYESPMSGNLYPTPVPGGIEAGPPAETEAPPAYDEPTPVPVPPSDDADGADTLPPGKSARRLYRDA